MDSSRAIAGILTLLIHGILVFYMPPDLPKTPPSSTPVILAAQLAPMPEPVYEPDPPDLLPEPVIPPEPLVPPEPPQLAPPVPFPTDRMTPVVSVKQTPVYPKIALINNWTGTVVLEVVIDPTGSVISITVAQSSGFTALDAAFIRAVRQQTYLPQEFQGKPIESTLKQAYTFKLDD